MYNFLLFASRIIILLHFSCVSQALFSTMYFYFKNYSFEPFSAPPEFTVNIKPHLGSPKGTSNSNNNTVEGAAVLQHVSSFTVAFTPAHLRNSCESLAHLHSDNYLPFVVLLVILYKKTYHSITCKSIELFFFYSAMGDKPLFHEY